MLNDRSGHFTVVTALDHNRLVTGKFIGVNDFDFQWLRWLVADHSALYVLMGFIYTAIGSPMLIFGNEKLKILGIIYIVMPIIMGIFGFIFFVIFAAIYNLLAKWLGGIEVEVKDINRWGLINRLEPTRSPLQ